MASSSSSDDNGIPIKKAKISDDGKNANSGRPTEPETGNVLHKPMCQYGAKCYRKNPLHRKEFRHPSSSEVKDMNSQIASGSPPKDLPPCKYGANCYRKNLLHFAQYSHPTRSDDSKLTSVKEEDESSDSCADTDTDIEPDEEKDNSNDMEANECMTTKSNGSIAKNDTILVRGPSILRCYSSLTEEQRKDLIRRAFEMKQHLVQELGETQKILREKNKELEKMRDQLDKGSLMVEGEAEALNGNKLVYFPLHAERTYREGSAAQIHFRLAESQFYRLLPAKSAFKVTKVEYVVEPELVKRFQKARNKLKKNRGEEASLPVLAFHGTKERNIHSICNEGFRVPGEQGFRHATDTGWYGSGVYFSEFPSYSMAYIRDGIKLLLCQVLPGKVFKCTRIIHGENLRHGHDSHMSPDGKELVIFNSHHILPSYVVYYKPMHGDFQYEKDE